MKHFYKSMATMMIAYMMISFLFICAMFYRDYQWWFAAGALTLWIISLVPSVIIIKQLFGGKEDG